MTSGIFALACIGLLALQAPASQGQAQRIALARIAPSPELASGLGDIVTGLGGQQAAPATESATEDSGLPFKWKKKHVGKGSYSSIAVDADGDPHVVYGRFVANNFVLTHAWAEGSHWFSEAIDEVPEPGFIGYDNSLAIDANGGLHVAYFANDGVTKSLRYAYNPGDGWQTEVVDSGGLSNSIAIDDEGFVHIVHLYDDDSAVRYAKQTASGWDLEAIPDVTGNWTAGTSLRLHDGKVYATFTTAFGELELAIRDSGIWSAQEIDPEGGRAGAMDFDQDGVPHVVYQNEGNIEFRHAWLDGLDWQIEALITQSTILGEPVPDGILAIGDNPALVEDSSGRLQLVFTLDLVQGEQHGQGLFGMFLAAGQWVPTMVIAKLGGDTSIAVAPNDLVHISTGKPKQGGGEGAGSITALRLSGAKLSLSIAPKESGTISVSPSGLECSGKAAEFDFPGSEVMLTAVPATGFSFVKWSPASLGTDPQVSITMDHGHKARAHFVKTPD